jgi:hypothetical protein
MEPEAFGFDAGLDELPEAAARVAVGGAWRLGTAEQAEAHRFAAAEASVVCLVAVEPAARASQRRALQGDRSGETALLRAVANGDGDLVSVPDV